ncbi:MarC family protein [Nonomuraea sp. B19D2]|uniref:MarC family protein n=1 Tax=Nonomuraea sp. B19D2 TaxID=3159561 RepID=UPI0032DAE06F
MSLFVQAFVTLLVIFDPLAAIPIFLTLTRSQDTVARRRTARISVLVAAGIVAVFAVLGNGLLDALGISLQALQVAGGVLLALIALDLLKADCARNRPTRRPARRERSHRSRPPWPYQAVQYLARGSALAPWS